jgi:hypothetical protein
LTAPAQAQPAQANTSNNPLQIRIGDSTIIPVGFMDLTNTFNRVYATSICHCRTDGSELIPQLRILRWMPGGDCVMS